jgi:hypothetical protein
VVDQIVAETGVQMTLGHRHADRGGDALAQRPGRRLDARRMTIFGVARRQRSPLAKGLQLLQGHARRACQVQQRILQH